MASIMELDENVAENIDQSINTLSNESIEDLAKVLSWHENVLKNILSSYEKLKERYIKLENSVYGQ